MINYLTRSTTEPTDPNPTDPNPEEEQPLEPVPEEEEENPFEDNTGNRDDILNAKSGDYNAWLEELNNMDVSTPNIPNINFGDEEQIYERLPLVVDSTKLIYNTKNFRLEDLTLFGQNTYKKYKEEFDRLNTVFAQEVENENNDYNDKLSTAITDEERQQITEEHELNLESIDKNKKTQIRTLNEDYLQKSFEIGKQIAAVKNGESNETGFIGDVFIDGKLNNTPIEDYLKKGDSIQIRDVENLEEELKTKADECHGHEINIQKLQLNLADIIHTHPISDVTNLQTELDKRANKQHTHVAADITDLQTELDKKANVVHEHAIEDITDLQTELDNKANVTHKHTVTDITDLQAELDKVANKEHTHTVADITDLQTELDKVANKEHTHETINNDLEINGNLSAKSNVNVEGVLNSNDITISKQRFITPGTYTVRMGADIMRQVYDDTTKRFIFMLVDDTTYIGKPLKITMNDAVVYNNDAYGVNEGSMVDSFNDAELYGDKRYFALSMKFSNSFGNVTIYVNDNYIFINNAYAHEEIDLNNPVTYNCLKDFLQSYPSHIDIHDMKHSMSNHTHKLADITDLQTELDNRPTYADISNKIVTTNVQVGNSMINTTITGNNIAFNCDGDMNKNRCEINNSVIKLTNSPFDSGTTNTTQIQADGITINGKQVLTKQAMIDLLYPVGAIYMSMNNVNPSTLFGGTWTQIQNRFLLCSNTSKKMGGSTFLTESNLPPHKHSFNATTSSDGSHTHTFSGKAITGEVGYDGGCGLLGPMTNGASGCFSRGTQSTWTSANLERTGYDIKFNATPSGTNSNSGTHSHSISGTTNNTGSKEDYWQPYMTCYCWYRTA